MYNNRETVFDRAQRTGFTAGPGNKMANRIPGGIEEGAKPSPAPGYHPAEDSDKMCDNCDNFDDLERNCRLYNFEANPTFVCASHAPKGSGEPAQVPGDAMPPPPPGPPPMGPPPGLPLRKPVL